MMRTLRQRAAVTLFWVSAAILMGTILAIVAAKGLEFWIRNY